MSTPSNLLQQLQSLEEIKKQNPYLTHVYMRTEDDRLVDIPIGQAEWTLRQYPTWEVEPVNQEEISPIDATVDSSHAHATENAPVAPSDDIDVPQKPSEEEPDKPKRTSRKRAS